MNDIDRNINAFFMAWRENREETDYSIEKLKKIVFDLVGMSPEEIRKTPDNDLTFDFWSLYSALKSYTGILHWMHQKAYQDRFDNIRKAIGLQI